LIEHEDVNGCFVGATAVLRKHRGDEQILVAVVIEVCGPDVRLADSTCGRKPHTPPLARRVTAFKTEITIRLWEHSRDPEVGARPWVQPAKITDLAQVFHPKWSLSGGETYCCCCQNPKGSVTH
jgi:hypothetical protein